ncbi:MAG: succinyl-diaminopimelate desuccinylase [Rhodocyclaceae bacterium]
MNPGSTLQLARDLICRPSVTPADAGCLEIIGARLAPLGFRVERLDCNGVSNLWARRGDAGPLVCFAGHTDVVPSGPRDAWLTDPFQPEEREGRLYGRGAADMKSSLAAFVTAIEAFLSAHPEPRGSIALLLTSDEEGDAVDGTIHVVDTLRARGEAIDYCVVGEPTSEAALGDTLKNGRRGSLSGKLVVRGVQGHVAYPQLARNPVHLAAPALAELAGVAWDQGDDFFPPTTWQISNIHAGTGANNVIPGALEVLFNFRFAPISTVEHLKAHLEGVLSKHDLDYRIDWTLSAEPYLTTPGDLVAAARRAVLEETGIVARLSTTGGTSDARFIAKICREVIELGPANATIHKANENVAVTALDPLSRIYRRILSALLVP